MKILQPVCFCIRKSDSFIKEKSKVKLSQESLHSHVAGKIKLKSTDILHLCTTQKARTGELETPESVSISAN